MGMSELEELLLNKKPVVCEKCKGRLFYISGGRYQCHSCGNIMLDDFGKIKAYIEENGPAPSIVIQQATGVATDIIELFLKQGRLEIPEGSRYYLNCEKCGCSIRYGRYCPKCVQNMADGIRGEFLKDVGETPKHQPSDEMKGKMHFLNTTRNGKR